MMNSPSSTVRVSERKHRVKLLLRLLLATSCGGALACGGDDKVGVTVHVGGDETGGRAAAAPGATGGTATTATGGTTSTGGTLPQAGGAGSGEVKINVDFNTCPEVSLVEAVPLELEAGGDPAQLTGSASDDDDDQLSVFWSVTSGYLSDPTNGNTKYSCTDEGTQTITFTVTDSNGCSDSSQIEIECS